MEGTRDVTMNMLAVQVSMSVAHQVLFHVHVRVLLVIVFVALRAVVKVDRLMTGRRSGASQGGRSLRRRSKSSSPFVTPRLLV